MVYRTGNNAYAIQQLGYGSTGAAVNTAGLANGERRSYPHFPALLEYARIIPQVIPNPAQIGEEATPAAPFQPAWTGAATHIAGVLD